MSEMVERVALTEMILTLSDQDWREWQEHVRRECAARREDKIEPRDEPEVPDDVWYG